jgi:hypothetical protein
MLNGEFDRSVLQRRGRSTTVLDALLELSIPESMLDTLLSAKDLLELGWTHTQTPLDPPMSKDTDLTVPEPSLDVPTVSELPPEPDGSPAVVLTTRDLELKLILSDADNSWPPPTPSQTLSPTHGVVDPEPLGTTRSSPPGGMPISSQSSPLEIQDPDAGLPTLPEINRASSVLDLPPTQTP